MIIHSFNEYHLGDSIIHLNYVRRLIAKNPDINYVHAVHPQYVNELKTIVQDLSNISIITLQDGASKKDIKWFNSWRNTNNFFFNHPRMHDIANFHLDWFQIFSNSIGISNPIHTVDDLWIDYPGLLHSTPLDDDYDYMVINCQPMSCQWKHWQQGCFDPLFQKLKDTGKKVISLESNGFDYPFTRSKGLSLTSVGHISIRCNKIIGVSTGPIWTILNSHNKKKEITVLFDHPHYDEDLSGYGIGISRCRTIADLMKTIS